MNKFNSPQTLKYYAYYGLYSRKWNVGVSNDTILQGTKYYTKENAEAIVSQLNKNGVMPKLEFTKILKD